jgi:hypothetical protein
MSEMRLVHFLCGIALLAPCLSAQSGASDVYIEQFRGLADKSEQFAVEVSQVVPGKLSLRERTAWGDRQSALMNLVSGLEMTAMRETMDLLKSGHDKDKALLLVIQGCRAVEFVLTSADDYISTDDRSFLALANDGRSIVASIKKSL